MRDKANELLFEYLEERRMFAQREHALRLSLQQLEVERKRAVENLECASRRKKAAFLNRKTQAVNSVKARIANTELLYEARIRQESEKIRRRIEELETRRKDIESRIALVPSDLRDVPHVPSSANTAGIHSEEQYAGLLEIMLDKSFGTVLRRALTSGGLRRSEAASVYLGMADADLRYILNEEQKVRSGSIEHHLVEERSREIANLNEELAEAERQEMTKDTSGDDVASLNERYARQALALKTKIAQQSSVDDCVQRFRSRFVSRAQEQKCTPILLNAPYEAPASVPRYMFDFWLLVDDMSGQMVYPHCFDAANPPSYTFPEDTAVSAIRSMTAFQLRTIPKGELQVIWFDPDAMGRSLGTLAPLARNQDKRRLVDLATTLSEIEEALANTIENMRVESLQIAGDNSAWEYNRNHNTNKIKRTLIVALGLGCDRYSQKSLNYLAEILDASSLLGIQLLAIPAKSGAIDGDAAPKVKSLISRTQQILKAADRLVFHISNQDFGVVLSDDAWVTRSLVDSIYEYRDIININLDTGDISDGLRVPFGVTEMGEVAELDFTSYAHAFVAGSTGSGKSSFLHHVIRSACSRYSPEDLSIWLVDYKKSEFSLYLNDSYQFPHIDFIGLDNSKDFVNALMRYLMDEFRHRQDLIIGSAARTIGDYNQKSGSKLPILLVIMDEFHRQSSLTAHDSDAYKSLDFLLREARAFGMHFLISDQGIGNLDGLSDGAKKQLGGRALLGWNEQSELNDMFDGQAYDLGLSSIEVGQAIVRNSGKMLLCDWPEWDEGQTRESVTMANEYHKRSRSVFTYDSNAPTSISLAAFPNATEKSIPIGTTADFLNPYLDLQIAPRRRDNVFILSKYNRLTMRLLGSICLGFCRPKLNRRTVLLAAEGEELYDDYMDEWECIGSRVPIDTYVGTDEVCAFLQSSNRTRDTLVVIIGLDALAEEFEEMPAKVGDGLRNGNLSQLSDLDKQIDYLIALEGSGEASAEDVNNDAYDARPELAALLKTGGRRGCHICVTDDIVPSMYGLLGAVIGQDDLQSLFPTRIATKCTYLEASSAGIPLAADIDDIDRSEKMVLVDKNGLMREFKPYLIKEWSS